MDQLHVSRSAAPPAAPEPSGAARPLLGGEFQRDLDVNTPSLPRTTLGRPQHLLELACRVAQASWGGVGLLSNDGELVEHLACGISEEGAAELMRSSWTAELLQFVLRQPLATRLRDFTQELPRLGTLPGLPIVGPFLGVPLNLTGRCRGVLYLAREQGEAPFSAQEEELIQPICTWLEQGRLLDEAHFQSQMQLLNRVAQSAAASLDLKRILASTMRELDRHLPLHVCAVWLIEEQEDVEVQPAGKDVSASGATAAHAAPPDYLALAEVSSISRDRTRALGLVAGLRLVLEQTPFVACVRQGQALYADWTRREPPGEPSLMPVQRPYTPSSNVSCFAVPLRAGDRVVGILQSLLTRPAGFTRDQIQLLYLVADLLGPAISNCQLFGRLHGAYDQLHLTQSQLIQAEKMRALGELASGMAHEFNNSLCGLLGFLELALLNKYLEPSYRSYLESARTCALDASETVRRVQDFARQHRDELNVKVLDLNGLVHQTLELTRHKWESLAHARGTPITLQTQTEAAGQVAGSPAELREVITNLVFNAVDAMPVGGNLTVRTWNTDSDVFLSVQDTGVGIQPSIRHRLFEPFFTTKGERGNGLGLSVVFGIVRRHRGEITVDSQVGQGSTFTVRLPLAPGKATSEADEPAPEPPAPTPSGLRVLVIEDDANVRQFLGKGLTTLGHRPRLTTNGHEGLAAFGEEPFDVVLTDLGLPGMSGEEVAQQVVEQSPGTPVIVLTGWADQLRAEKNTMQGVAGILGKPIGLDVLAHTLASICPAQR